jgi:hypothetical protein
MTASVTFLPRRVSASFFSLVRIMAEISSGRIHLPDKFTSMPPLAALRVLEWHVLYIFLHSRLVKGVAHEALDLEDGVLWVRHRLPLGQEAHEPLARL